MQQNRIDIHALDLQGNLSKVNRHGAQQSSLYGGVHPRAVRFFHAHMYLKYNVHILKLTRQISFTFGF